VVALTADDADTAGIFVRDRDFTGRIQTANGSARVAPVVLDEVTIGDITVRDVRAVVSEPGALSVSLLGMTFLNQLDRVDMRSGKLILQD
jgi:aspartyl protease family protein